MCIIHNICVYTYIYIYICLCIYLYIHTHTKRETERSPPAEASPPQARGGRGRPGGEGAAYPRREGPPVPCFQGEILHNRHRKNKIPLDIGKRRSKYMGDFQYKSTGQVIILWNIPLTSEIMLELFTEIPWDMPLKIHDDF